MGENEEPINNRERVVNRLREKYPDFDGANDEALFEQINNDYDENEKNLNGYAERENKLVELFNKDPRSAQFITDMARGNDPFISTIERIGIDGMTDLINDPEKREQYAEANAAYLKNVAKEKELEELYEQNLSQSLTTLDEIQKNRGLSDEELDNAMELLIGIANDALVGKFTPENIDIALKAINHDVNVEAASQEGEIRGRNARIEERLRKPQMGDGQPVLGGANNPVRDMPKSKGVFELAKRAK